MTSSMPESLSIVTAYKQDNSQEAGRNASPHDTRDKANLTQENTMTHTSSRSSTPWISQDYSASDLRDYPRFTRSPPPTFSGERCEWPEFRAIWRKHGAREYPTDEERAWALKRCLKGKALEHVKAIFVTQENAYQRIWDRLDNVYSDISHNIQSAFSKLHKLRQVGENDLQGMVNFVNEVEMCYSNLGEIGQVNAVTLNQVDSLGDLLPVSCRKEWLRIYRQLPQDDRIRPFSSFMGFLEGERDDSLRLAERACGRKHGNTVTRNEPHKAQRAYHAQSQPQSTTSSKGTNQNYNYISKCAVHNQQNTTHITENCRDFQTITIAERLEALKKARVCFRCFGKHRRDQCRAQEPCKVCNKTNHHYLLCKANSSDTANSSANNPVSTITSKTNNRNPQAQSHTTAVSNKAVGGPSRSILPIMEVKTCDLQTRATILFDSGSDCSYIREQSARSVKAKRLGRVTLDVVTMGGQSTEYNTHQYEVPLITANGTVSNVIAYGMENITGPLSKLNERTVKDLFPYFDPTSLMRTSTTVDILLGNDYYGLYPKKEIGTSGPHLSIMEGELGICLQGSHPRLSEATTVTNDCSEVYNVSAVNKVVTSNLAHTGPRHSSLVKDGVGRAQTHIAKMELSQLETFIQGEEMGTEVVPKCGGCKCSKCPIVGHTYSFKEQQELDLIRNNLRHDEKNKRWVTGYPWLRDPSNLPNNYGSALATLKSCEKGLLKDDKWASVYKEQIQDMVQRQVARKLSAAEVEEWDGPAFYISHLAVRNPKSETTPVRIVFNSSQTYQGVSLNSMLAKGPDAYINNILGILLRWREESSAFVGDIRKMFNSIFIEELEQHCHRFLWRDLEVDRSPDVYIIQRVNMGDKPAGAISSEAIYKTATLWEDTYPEVSEVLRHSTYVDDIVDSKSSLGETTSLAERTEEVLLSVGFQVKGWRFSGESASRTNANMPQIKDPDKQTTTRVLGVIWDSKRDQIYVNSGLNFSEKRRGVHTEQDLTSDALLKSVPLILTRRLVLEQVMRIYDPLGLLSPFTLQAKCYLRETWVMKLKWDDPLPEELRTRWIQLFEQFIHLPAHAFDRCMKPGAAIGKPSLVIFSDGSETAYGFAAYVRWKLKDGTYFCRLVCSKSRIAPLKRVSIPQMELNAAVLSKRARKMLEKEMRYNFERVTHLVDSETVLCMLQRVATRFKMYEGVRVGEIQAATNGDMSSWFWVSGKSNIADWVTRPKPLAELHQGSEWWRGPSFLYLDEESWDIRSSKSYASEHVHEESLSLVATNSNKKAPDEPIVDYSQYSNAGKLVWVVARILGALQAKSFKGGQTKYITPDVLDQTKTILAKDAQKSITSELQSTNNGKYKQLKPTKDREGLWVIGERVLQHNPLSTCRPQILLPTNHEYTRLIMKEAHEKGGHRGRDATLARFRQTYWTPQGSKVAKALKNSCQLCRVRDPVLLKQAMGQLPIDRLRPSPPFTSVMLDLFGPFLVRGEVQKRTSGKAYGVIFTDLYSRAVHIEAAFGYDTRSFILALIRFASIRGWPQRIFSDPGSQLVGAEREMTTIWESIEKEAVYKESASNGTQWTFGPADSPWNQGAVEALVKSAKRCFKMAINSQRLAPSEFTTLCAETANILNERPIGTLPSSDSEINILTPNCLLLGRSESANPGGWDHKFSHQAGLELTGRVAGDFWKHWTGLYAPALIPQQKWYRPTPNLKPGDVVAVADSNALKGRYYIGQVSEVHPSKDGLIRKVTIRYKTYKQGEKTNVYRGAKDTKIIRSVQRLALLVPVDSGVGGTVGERVASDSGGVAVVSGTK